MQEVQNILGSRQPASANTSTFWQHKNDTLALLLHNIYMQDNIIRF